jgi:MFS transporter, FHS family, glucose/mannose:H+ symporter
VHRGPRRSTGAGSRVARGTGALAALPSTMLVPMADEGLDGIPRRDDPRDAAGRQRARLAAGIVGCLTFIAIGWTGLLVPSLIRSIEATFGQTDAGIGIVYLAYAVAYASASFGGGPLTERLGRRPVLGVSVLVTGLGAAGLGLAPTWPAFVATALLAGAGAGSLDGGVNGLILDVYRDGRGRAMNLLHMSYSVGALAAPLAVGALVEGGVPWQATAVGTGALISLLAVAYAAVPMPSGRRRGVTVGAHLLATAGGQPGRSLLAGPLLLLGIAIAAYVACEVGVSSWLVRFLEPAPLTTATLALSLYWAGLAAGRLVSSAVADRFDHLRFTVACALAMAVFVAAAVLVPSLPLSIAAFAAAGFASGPVFPMIVAIGGDRYPDRSAAVGGSLVGMAVVGSVVYPPAMGFMSVAIGLPIAMLGNAVLALACVLALGAFGRATRTSPGVGGS